MCEIFVDMPELKEANILFAYTAWAEWGATCVKETAIPATLISPNVKNKKRVAVSQSSMECCVRLVRRMGS
jgi:hypothetical protein